MKEVIYLNKNINLVDLNLDVYDDDFKFIVFGTGYDYFKFIEDMKMLFQLLKIEKSVDHCITAIIDNSEEKQGAALNGIKVSSPEILKQKGNEIIVVATLKYYSEIFEQLKTMGFEEGIHYVFYQDYFVDIINAVLHRLKKEEFLGLVKEFQKEKNDAGQAVDFINFLRGVKVESALVKKISHFFFDDYVFYRYLQTFPQYADGIISLALQKILQERLHFKGLYNVSDIAIHAKMEKRWNQWFDSAPFNVRNHPFFLSLKEWIELFYVERKNNSSLDRHLERYIEDIVDIDNKLKKNSNVVELGASNAIVSLGLGILGHNVLSTDLTRGFLGKADLYMQVGEWIRLHLIKGIMIDIFDANEIENCRNLDIFSSETIAHQGIDCIFLSGTGIFALNKSKTATLSQSVEETYKRISPFYKLLNTDGILYAKKELFDVVIRDPKIQAEKFFPQLKEILISRLNPSICSLKADQNVNQYEPIWSLYRYSLFLKK